MNTLDLKRLAAIRERLSRALLREATESEAIRYALAVAYGSAQ